MSLMSAACRDERMLISDVNLPARTDRVDWLGHCFQFSPQHDLC